jgi:phosphomevalonate kinase
MTYSSFRVKVPGKLLIAGEYAVLEPRQRAVVVAVDRYVTAFIEPCGKNQLSIPSFGLDEIIWDLENPFVHPDPRLRFIQSSINIVNQYVQESSVPLRPFHLTIKSELNDLSSGKKYGLGSSAAVVVAVISAILTLYGEGKEEPKLTHIFKLAAIAHLNTQKNGSGVDIAAATYGGWLVYSPFDSKWVEKELRRGVSLSKLLEKLWPNLAITPIKPPSKLRLSVGWTGESAQTATMIRKVHEFRKRNPEVYKQFLEESSLAVNRLIISFKNNNHDEAILSLSQNRNALLTLGDSTGIPIETFKLKALSVLAERYGSGKSSGAGGGDCGIALTSEERADELHEAWRNKGIVPLNIGVSHAGAAVTEYNCEMNLKEYLVTV